MAKCIKCGYDPDVKQVDDKELEKEIKYLEDDIKNESKITPEMAMDYALEFIGVNQKKRELVDKKDNPSQH